MVSPARTDNRAPRVTACPSCGTEIRAGRRGPFPRCPACRAKADPNPELRHRIATARNTAIAVGRDDVAARLDDVGETLIQGWTRLGE